MRKKTKGWSDERRAKQAETIRKTQPWKTTSGPKTESGKAATSQNALKSGLHTAEIKALKSVLRLQKTYLKLWSQK
ncbi:MAG: hypothetical protein GW778_01525 [Alphaproteobacteria bacterium]|nr:hypothetical protein [Alphaproteobacteria bacterium]